MVSNYYCKTNYEMRVLPDPLSSNGSGAEIGDSLRASVCTVLGTNANATNAGGGYETVPNFGAKPSYESDIKSFFADKTLTKVPLEHIASDGGDLQGNETSASGNHSYKGHLPSWAKCGMICILRGESPRFSNTGHVIVARISALNRSGFDGDGDGDGEVGSSMASVMLEPFHDPHPSKSNIRPRSAKWMMLSLKKESIRHLALPAFSCERTPIYIKGAYTKVSR